MQRYEEPVEVRRREGDPEQGPEQFLWRGRLWQVRRVLAHQVETGERWRVEAGRGPAGGTGVFELALDRADGRWQLVGSHD